MIPKSVVRIRQNLCRGKCDVDANDPCAKCPNGHWGPYALSGCPGAKIFVETPIPSKDWPIWLRPSKLLAIEGDKGLGDIVERVIGPVGGDAYKIWYLKTFGKTCGCTHRQDGLNERYPL
jgi:hypothetical protein